MLTTYYSWRLSRNETKEKNFSKNEPDPTPQILKLFAEDYIVTRKKLPCPKSACHNFTCFTSLWERETLRTLPKEVKNDVLNVISHTRSLDTVTDLVSKYIRNELAPKHGLPTGIRDQALVTAKDIEYLLHRLFGEDNHDYVHEWARVQIGSSLSLFAGSGARAGAIIESSAYRDSNECLYYKVGYIIYQSLKYYDLTQHSTWLLISNGVKMDLSNDGWRLTLNS